MSSPNAGKITVHLLVGIEEADLLDDFAKKHGAKRIGDIIILKYRMHQVKYEFDSEEDAESFKAEAEYVFNSDVWFLA